MSFIRNISITFTTKVILFFVGLFSSIILARALGPEGKGLFSLTIVAATLVINLTGLGVGMGSGYFLGRRKLPLDLLAGNWLSLSLIIGVSAMAISVVLAPNLVTRFLPSVPVWFVVIALVSIPFTFLLHNFQALFKANNDFRSFNILELTQPASFLLLFVVMICIFPERKIAVAVVAFLLSYATAGIFTICLAAGVTDLSFRLSWDLAKAALRFGLQVYIANLLAFLNLRLDIFLVNFFLGPAHVGYYTISVLVAGKIWYVPGVLSAVLYPRVAHGSEEDANRDTTIVSRQTVIIVFLLCLSMLFLGRFVIRLFFSELFLQAVIPLFLLLPGIFSASLTRIITHDLLARGYPRVIMWGGLVGVLTNIGFNILLIPRFGVSGAALASTFSYTLNALIIIVAFINITGIPLRSILVPGIDDFRLTVRSIGRILNWRKDTEA